MSVLFVNGFGRLCIFCGVSLRPLRPIYAARCRLGSQPPKLSVRADSCFYFRINGFLLYTAMCKKMSIPYVRIFFVTIDKIICYI